MPIEQTTRELPVTPVPETVTSIIRRCHACRELFSNQIDPDILEETRHTTIRDPVLAQVSSNSRWHNCWTGIQMKDPGAGMQGRQRGKSENNVLYADCHLLSCLPVLRGMLTVVRAGNPFHVSLPYCITLLILACMHTLWRYMKGGKQLLWTLRAG